MSAIVVNAYANGGAVKIELKNVSGATIPAGFPNIIHSRCFATAQSSNNADAFWDAEPTGITGGGDLECYSDASLTTRIPLQVLVYDGPNKELIAFAKKSGTILISESLWLVRGNGQVAQPARDSTNGRENVWSSYAFVSHGLVVGTADTDDDAAVIGDPGGDEPVVTADGDRHLFFPGMTWANDAQNNKILFTIINSGAGYNDNPAVLSKTMLFLRDGSDGYILEQGAYGGSFTDQIYQDDTGGVFEIGTAFSTTNGQWTFSEPSTAAYHYMTVVHDRSSASNNPVVYLDGTTPIVSEATAPVGTRTSTLHGWRIFNDRNEVSQSDGRVAFVRFAHSDLGSTWYNLEYESAFTPETVLLAEVNQLL